MPTNPQRPRLWAREELLQLLSLSGTMAGLCITGVTLFHTSSIAAPGATVADDMLLICGLSFLVCAHLTFLALRIRNPRLVGILELLVDVLFPLALTAMVATGFV